ncbi:PilZ domain-containing protein [Qipengyuania sp. JC766]|uniref:PilZ domain-containing protein n=1 Tax=Qipengyuania sp. JC766 TaxID=3232139 RepID=UPI0034577B2B
MHLPRGSLPSGIDDGSAVTPHLSAPTSAPHSRDEETRTPLGDAPTHAEIVECRRAADRHLTFLRPCCITLAHGAYLALVRNLSPVGAQIETDQDLRVGETLEYFWDGIEPIEARVVWQDGRRVGVENLAEADPKIFARPDRSARIPCERNAQIWVEGNRFQAVVLNISLRGLMAYGLPEFAPGTLATICLGRRSFEQTRLRWVAHGSAGFQFAEPLGANLLMELLRENDCDPKDRMVA